MSGDISNQTRLHFYCLLVSSVRCKQWDGHRYNSVLADYLVSCIFPGKSTDDLSHLFQTCCSLYLRFVLGFLEGQLWFLAFQNSVLICTEVLFILTTSLLQGRQAGVRSAVFSPWKMHSHGCLLETPAHSGQDQGNHFQGFHLYKE